MIDFWDKCIHRAEELAGENPATAQLVKFYAELLRAQKQVFEFLRGRRDWLPSGLLADYLLVLEQCLPNFLQAVEANAPEALRSEAKRLSLGTSEVIHDVLLSYWHSSDASDFFAKAFLQPYSRWLAESGGRPLDRSFANDENRCPFCGGLPQVSYLQIREASAESGNRELVCATCLGAWSFRRVVCAFCSEERPDKLAYFQTPEFDHVRLEACETCKRYIKGVDLTRFGLAVPIVDEVAAAALDLWATERGFVKIELNLLGL